MQERREYARWNQGQVHARARAGAARVDERDLGRHTAFAVVLAVTYDDKKFSQIWIRWHGQGGVPTGL